MGLDIAATSFTQSDYQAFQDRLENNLAALQQVLQRPGFGKGETSLGAELGMYIASSTPVRVLLRLHRDSRRESNRSTTQMEKGMSAITIRPAVREDAALILHFVTELAIYEKAEHEVRATVSDIENSLFALDSTARAIICEVQGAPAGFAVYFFNYSTWLGKNGLYLEDLYVSPACRKLGAGKALFIYLARIALDHDCGRFEWSVLDWNEAAMAFYRAMGAEPRRDWIPYRLDRQGIETLAASQ